MVHPFSLVNDKRMPNADFLLKTNEIWFNKKYDNSKSLKLHTCLGILMLH